jgi:hypothetical protein
MPQGNSRYKGAKGTRFASPSSRKSITPMTPMSIDSPTKCKVSAIGQTHACPRTNADAGVVLSHVENDCTNSLIIVIPFNE